jgi:tetratricopeptide (TPR) repeat protein
MLNDRTEAAAPAAARGRLGPEPLLEIYESALQALHRGRLAEAEGLFARVANDCDQPELAHRARQFQSVCRRDTGATEPLGGDDPYLLAVYEKNRGNLARALELARTGSRDDQDERFAYLVASIHALAARATEAKQALGKAIDMNRKNRVYAYHDPDFAALRESEDFAPLFAS